MFNMLYSSPSAFDFVGIFGNIVERWYFYLALLVVIVGLILFFLFVKPIKRDRLTKTQKLVYISVLTALSVIANVFTFVPTQYSGFSVTITVCFIAGYLLGAKAGFIVGFVGDLLGAIIFPQGPYLPLMSLSSGLFGMFPGVLFSYFDNGKKLNIYVKTALSGLLILVICTVGLNTFSLWVVYAMGKKSFFAYLGVRIPWQILNALVNCILCSIIAGLLPKLLPKSKFVFNQDKTKREDISGEEIACENQVEEESNED